MFAFNVRKTLHSQNGDEKIERMAARGGWRPFCILHFFSIYLVREIIIIFVMEGKVREF